MPRILAPYPTKVEQRKGKQLPDGRLKFREMARAARKEYDVHWPQFVAVDTETTGVGFYDRAFCTTLTWRAPHDHGGGLRNWYFEMDVDGAYDDLEYILEDVAHRGHMVFHNARFDIQKLILAGVLERDKLDHSRIHDTEAQAHLLDPLQPKKLKQLAEKYLGETTNEAKRLAQVRRTLGLTVEDGYDPLPRWVVMPYALKDTEFTLRLHEMLYPQLMATGDGLPELYAHEQELMLVLLDMEAAGMRVDLAYLDKAIATYQSLERRHERDLFEMTGENFNPNSNEQLAAHLIARGHELPLTEKGQPRVDKMTLLETGDDLAKTLLELRAVQKTLHTYLEPMHREQRDGLIHAGLRQHGARTGRFSSGAASNN